MTGPTSSPKAGPAVETAHGRLRGTIESGVHIFRGVRYGESTGGANRFLPPQPVQPWAGLRNAAAWGGSAPQSAVPENTDPFYAWYSAIQPISEDCLFLNLFTPGLDGARRPILFWIHGGGWREGSGTAPGFNGAALARAQNVVVVTINHRLNGFGFLQLAGSGERFADAGNAGLLDILAALRWVRDHAAVFGGDADNVTLFGESGGASKIAAILAMRAAAGLFRKAIIQSSAGGLYLASAHEASRAAAALARVLDCDRLDAERLQNLPMPVLVTAIQQAGGPFRGMIDGRSFDADPFAAAAPAVSRHIPVLIGCTNTESTYYLRGDPKNFALAFTDITRRLARFLKISPPQVEKIIAHYRCIFPDLDASGIMIMITSDFIFKRNTYRIAELQADGTAAVYAYLFARESPVEDGRTRACHTSEVPFIFGTTDVASPHVGTGSDIGPMTDLMMASWAAFARTGDPNNPALPSWRPFADPDRPIMVLNGASRLLPDPGGEARRALDELPYFTYGYAIDAFCRD